MKTKVIKFLPSTGLSELFQSLDIKFAFVDDTLSQVSVAAKCRDFLGDVLWSKETSSNVSIYRFIYDYKKTPFSSKKLRLSLKFPSDESKNYFISNLHLLHDKEKQAKTSLTKIYSTQEKDTLLIEASKLWQSSVWKISLYTYYLKIFSYKNIKYLETPENRYNKVLTPIVENKFLSKVKGRKKFFGASLKFNHDHSGFYTLIQYGKTYNPVLYKYIFTTN